jgi:23S rRNA pseudouridine2605 synthase
MNDNRNKNRRSGKDPSSGRSSGRPTRDSSDSSSGRPTRDSSGRPAQNTRPGSARGKQQEKAPGRGQGKSHPGRSNPREDSSREKTYGKPGFKKDPKRQNQPSKKDEVRLNKYIAHAGICSRREADKLIEAGLISVNGKVVSDLGTKVAPGDDVRYNGERMGNERKVYLLLNKPKDYITTVDDPHAKKTVMELVDRACKERIYPVGRLDKNTTGVLLFTNDGELTRRLTHPSFNKKKTYHVFLNRNLRQEDLRKIAEGIELEDGFIQVDAIAYASQDSKKEIGLEIHSGKNRIVRRIFEHLGYKVTKLDRVYFAGLTKKNLPRGRWRFLTDKEIKMLKMNAFE